MNRSIAAALASAGLLLAASSARAAPAGIRSVDFTPNPAFVPIGHGSTRDTRKGGVEQLGEVVILEGDSSLVADDGMGGYGITFDQTDQKPPNITARFYEKYADEFDEIVVLTTFDDDASRGALAYEISAQQDVRGIGQVTFDESGADGWGAPDHKLFAFVNMMRWDQFKDVDGRDPTDPRSELYPTLGQEFAHRWLSFLKYKDKSGKVSDAMLGRDKAHWASTLHASASVMDGNAWVDNGDGTFSDKESMARYSPLDLYAMGLVPAEEVPPWFLINGATDAKSGKKLNPTSYLRVGTVAKGMREDIDISQVIAAHGPRIPSAADSPHQFRVAFVLLTRPGETAGQVVEIARAVEQIRLNWEKAFGAYTGGKGVMCTQVSAPCGAATAKVVRGAVTEAGGNHNGIVEPGEPVEATFTLANDGLSAAAPVAVKAGGDRVKFSDTAPAAVAKLDPGGMVDVTFSGALASDATCGVATTVRVESMVDKHVFRGFAQVTPGLATRAREEFAKSAGSYAVNAAGGDTTTKNGWEYGQPVEYHYSATGFVFQPGDCHAGAKCWFTGLQKGVRGTTQSSVGVGSTSLWSREYDARGLYKPTLRYYAWYEAIDYSHIQQGGRVLDDLPLVVEATGDGGKSWVKVDAVTGAEPRWQLRAVPLPLDKLGGGKPGTTLRLRFTASSPSDTTVVEAGIDDVAVETLTPACNPDAAKEPAQAMPMLADSGGCACSTSGRAPASTPVAAALALVALAGLARARRRRRTR